MSSARTRATHRSGPRSSRRPRSAAGAKPSTGIGLRTGVLAGVLAAGLGLGACGQVQTQRASIERRPMPVEPDASFVRAEPTRTFNVVPPGAVAQAEPTID